MIESGRIVEVDLARGTHFFSPLTGEMIQRHIGGRGFNAEYLYHCNPPKIDPLAPENRLLFSSGLLSDTIAPASSRLHISALSPLTGLLGSSNTGGGAGPALCACGIRSLIVRGRSERPVYLVIAGDTITVCDASALWGMDTWETENRLKEIHCASETSVMSIGPAGENGVGFACIIVDRHHAAGRTGMGAVMGSKNLKAIVIEKRHRRHSAFPTDKAARAVKQYIRQIKNAPEFKAMSTFGGAGYLKWADERGMLATRNYRQNRFEEIDSIDGRKLKKYVVRSRGCKRCPVQCKAELRMPANQDSALRPEFEPMACIGAKCGLSDLDALVHIDNLCSRLGLDNISTSSAIAFAMDLYERGIISESDAGGLELAWGNKGAMIALVEQMADRSGLGAVLSHGIRKAACIIGRGSERFAPHVKGLELTSYHPGAVMGTALGYTIANRGGDFNDIYANLEYQWPLDKLGLEFKTKSKSDIWRDNEKALMVKRARVVSMVLDCLGLCKVPVLSLIGAFDLVNEAELVTCLTGWSVTPEDLLKIGERLVDIERQFNYKHGATCQDDALPAMFFTRDYSPAAAPQELSERMDPMRQAFYQAMKWDEFGAPVAEKKKVVDSAA